MVVFYCERGREQLRAGSLKQLDSLGWKSSPAAVEGTGTVDIKHGLVSSTEELGKDTFLPYILHLALSVGRKPFSCFPFNPVLEPIHFSTAF